MKLIYKILISKSKKQLILISLIILLSTTVVFTSLISINSMINTMVEKLIFIEDGHIKIDFYSKDFNKAKITHKKYLDKVTNYLSIIYSKEKNSQVVLKKVSKSYFNKDRLKALNLNKINILDKPSIIISKNTSDKLNVKVNDKLVALVISNNKAKMQMFTVSDIFNTSYSYLDDKLAYILNVDSLDILKNEPSYYLILDENNEKVLEQTIKEINLFDLSSFSQTYLDINPALYENFINSENTLYLLFSFLLLFAIAYIALSAFNIANDNSREMILLTINGQSPLKTSSIYAFIVSALVLIIEIPAFIISILIVKFIPYLIKDSSIFDYYIKDFSLIIPYKNIILITLVFIFIIFIVFNLIIKRVLKKRLLLFTLDI